MTLASLAHFAGTCFWKTMDEYLNRPWILEYERRCHQLSHNRVLVSRLFIRTWQIYSAISIRTISTGNWEWWCWLSDDLCTVYILALHVWPNIFVENQNVWLAILKIFILLRMSYRLLRWSLFSNRRWIVFMGPSSQST